MVTMGSRLNDINLRIERAARKTGRSRRDITLVAVTKTVEIETIEEAFSLGISDFGENRVQELVRKKNSLPDARWHLIGRLQTNKVKDVVGRACLIHSLDRWPLAEEINKRGLAQAIEVPVLVQVNISGETSKTGLGPKNVESFLEAIGELRALRVLGLMTIAPENPDTESSRPVFRELALIRNRVKKKNFTNVDLRFLSMGMSQDFEVAIEEGADIVRIGSALFK